MWDLGLIILNYNSAEDTLRCVGQLVSFRKNYHIIVVDNCSTDDSLQRIRSELSTFSDIDIIQTQENGGYSAGNNYGMKYAISKYGVDALGILNPDVIIPRAEVIDNLLSTLMNNEEYGIIGGATLNAKGEHNINRACWDIPASKDLVLGQSLLTKGCNRTRNFKMLSDNIAQTECVVGCFFLTKVAVMEKIGFLDENVFLYNEENILGIKCKQQGFKVVVALDQFYIHNHRYNSSAIMPYSKKVMATRNSYLSRKYLCSTYYNKKLLPLLALVELSNRIYLTLCFIAKGMIHKKHE